MRSESEIRSLILMSLRILKTMILPSSLFCYERTKGRPGSSGCSVRYTLITLLGLIAARRIGYDVEFDIDEIYRAALAECDSINIGPGDYGLYLWVDSELNGRNVPALLQKLETSLERRGGYSSCIGLEIAWIVIGTTRATERSGSRTGLNFLKRALESIRTRYVSDCGLFYHLGQTNTRRRFPNFATQIYNILALSSAAQFLEDDQLLTTAKRAADKLLASQLPCGGWPWLYDAAKGTVVERYEIYSVHQDGMAPMSFLKLSEVSGDPKYARAAFEGLDWMYSTNELGLNMIDEKEALIYRSIRRRKPFDRLLLAMNTGLSILGAPNDAADGMFLAINPTCRPYHLRWILFAWSGSENFSVGMPA